MKKMIVLVGLCLICMTGCGQETKTMVCTRSANQNGIQVDLRYEVEYTKNTVDKVSSTEKITSDTSAVLESYKKTIEETYAPYNDIEHYDYEVTIDGNTLTSIANIDYSKIDTDKMIEVDSANGQLIQNGKIDIDDLKSAYEMVGAICEK